MVGLLIIASLILLFFQDYFLPLLNNSTISPSVFAFQFDDFIEHALSFCQVPEAGTQLLFGLGMITWSQTKQDHKTGESGMTLGLGSCCAPLEDRGRVVLPLTRARWNHPLSKSNQAAVFSPRSQLLFARAGSWRCDTHTWDFVPDWYRPASLRLLHQRRLGCRHGGRRGHVARAPGEALGTQHQVRTQLLLVEPGQLQPHPHWHGAREHRNR